MSNTIRTVPRKWPGKSSIWGTLNLAEVEVLREFLNRFIDVCSDADNKIDPADKKRIANVKKILLAQ